MFSVVTVRDAKHTNFVEFRNFKIVYRRYAGLYFCICVDVNDNNLYYLEAIHNFVEVLNEYFHNVCELDLVFNFYKVNRYLIISITFNIPVCSRCTPLWMKCSWLAKSARPVRQRCWSSWPCTTPWSRSWTDWSRPKSWCLPLYFYCDSNDQDFLFRKLLKSSFQLWNTLHLFTINLLMLK